MDKVDHVAGQLKVRTVPVEDLLLFSAVYFVMPSLLRSLTVQTSTFFLSDEREEVKRPLSIREDRPVKTRRLYIHEVDMHAQMTKEIHGVGPNGDRWDGIDVIVDWYMECVRMKSSQETGLGYYEETLVLENLDLNPVRPFGPDRLSWI